MDVLNLLELVEGEIVPRWIRDRSDPLQYFSNVEFRDRYRMHKAKFFGELVQWLDIPEPQSEGKSYF